MDADATLARWLLAHAPEPLTHLKLQKLCFYAYGACLAHDRDIGDIAFEAWQHGPVCPRLWREYRDSGAVPIPRPLDHGAGFEPLTKSVLEDVLTVYGALSAWELRNQSHLEAPWRDNWDEKRAGAKIPRASIASHFRQLFRTGRVAPPTYLVGGGSFALDGVPTGTYGSLHELADAMRA